jgi:hypothetical protein
MTHGKKKQNRIPTRETPRQEAEVMMALGSGRESREGRDVSLTLVDGGGVLVHHRRAGAGRGETPVHSEDEALCLLE